MRTIYKQRLNVDGIITRFNSKIEKILKLDSQNGVPTMWYIFNDTLPEVEYVVSCYGTGWSLLEDATEFIGTVEDSEGYIWHYFAVPDSKDGESGHKYRYTLAANDREDGNKKEDLHKKIENLHNEINDIISQICELETKRLQCYRQEIFKLQCKKNILEKVLDDYVKELLGYHDE